MNFIKKIVDGKIDNSVHLQFQKFSKGEFVNKALIKAKKMAGKYSIATDPEFANELVRVCAEKLGDEKTKITGAIVSTNDLTGELEFKEKKQFQGVKRYLIDQEMSGKEIILLLHKFPKTFFALSFKTSDSELKIKPKAPKSGKPGKEGEKPSIDFCKIKTSDKNIAKGFIFEKEDFKEAEIKHKFVIEDIIISDELRKTEDFARIREEAKRKGKIIREVIIDGQELKKEFDFEA